MVQLACCSGRLQPSKWAGSNHEAAGVAGVGKHKATDCQQMAEALGNAGLEAIVLDAQVPAETGKCSLYMTGH
jgi:hypothetical protein